MRNFILVMAVIMLASCGSTKYKVPQTLKHLKIARYELPEKLDYDITSATIESDKLIVGVRYRGGKAIHDFELLFNGAMMKSLPPQAVFYLKHSHGIEACEGLVSRKLEYDLKAMVDLGYEEVVIHLFGWDEELRYKK